MPKETVQYPSTDGLVSTEVSVHWTKGPSGWIQLAVHRHPWQQPQCPNGCDGIKTGCSACPPSGRLAPGVSHSLDPADEAVYRLPPGDNAELADVQPDGSSIMWADPLTRDDLNKLIRALRRARDQVFGRDE